jgi:CheY-like chemotaxis protein
MWLLALANFGHEIEIAETVDEATARLGSTLFDLTIVDLRLPELKDGLAVIRKAAENASTKILVFSGWPEDLEPLPERKLVHRILVKPVRLPTLLQAISDLASRAAAG